MLAILIFGATFAALGAYLWRNRKSAKEAAEMSKLDAAVKAEGDRLRKLAP